MKYLIEDIPITLFIEAFEGIIGLYKVVEELRVDGGIDGIHRQVRVALDELGIPFGLAAFIVIFQEFVAAAVVGILQVMLEFVVHHGLRVACIDRWRVDPDPALARGGPVSDTGPADALLQADIDVIPTADIKRVVVENLVITVPGLMSPSGDILGIRIVGNAVHQGIGRPIDHSGHRRHIIGEPDRDILGRGSHGEALDETLIQQDSIDGRTTGARCLG